MKPWPISPVEAPAGAWRGCALWRVELDEIDVSRIPTTALCEFERHRAERFHFQRDADRYRSAHWALRLVLAEAIGASPASIRIGEGMHGKPRFEDGTPVGFNLSHSQGVAVVAVSDDETPIGVDVERVWQLPDVAALVSAHFTTGERAAWDRFPPAMQAAGFLAIWTRKEAALKALGTGLLVDANRVETGNPDARWVCRIDADAKAHIVEIEPSLMLNGTVISLARHPQPLHPRPESALRRRAEHVFDSRTLVVSQSAGRFDVRPAC